LTYLDVYVVWGFVILCLVAFLAFLTDQAAANHSTERAERLNYWGAIVLFVLYAGLNIYLGTVGLVSYCRYRVWLRAAAKPWRVKPAS
jgi:Ca2+/Na+ antiporter